MTRTIRVTLIRFQSPIRSRGYVGRIVDDLHEAEDLAVVVEDRMDITVDRIIPEFLQLAPRVSSLR